METAAPRALRVRAVHPLGAATALLVVAAAIPPSVPRAFLLGLAAGVAPMLAVRERWSVGELLCAPVLAAVPLWAIAALAGWSVGADAALGWWPAAAAGALTLAELRRRRELTVTASAADVAAIAIIAALALPVWAVFSHNGAEPGASAPASYEAREWFARDSFYFFALAQRCADGRRTPDENPFVAGAPNVYPTLLHCGLGAVAARADLPAAIVVPALAPWLLLASAGFVVLVAAAWAPGRARGRGGALLLAVGVLALLALRLDLYVYPQSQAFALGTLLLALWFLGPTRARPIDAAAAVVLLACLVFAHTVSSAFGILVLAARATEELASRESRRDGLALAGAAVALGVAFLLVNQFPHPAARASSASPAALRAAWNVSRPWIAPAVAILLVALASLRRPVRASLPIGALALAAIYHWQGAHAADPVAATFARFNAERFVHLGWLAALLLLAEVRPWAGRAAVAVVVAGLVVLPPPLSLRSVRLVEQPPLSLDREDLETLAIVRKVTPVTARLVVDFDNYAIPAFTGRGQAALEVGAWSTGTLPPGDEVARLYEHAGFWRSSPEQRLATIRRRGYTHALLAAAMSPAEARSFTEHLLPADAPARLLYHGASALLLQLQPP